MSPRQLFTGTTLFLSVVGLFFAFAPFIDALDINAKALAKRPHYRIDDIGVGDYKFVTVGPSGYWSTTFLFYRPSQSDVSVWALPQVKGKFLMPDRTWWRGGYLCQDFGLDRERMVFRCLDEALEGDRWAQREWQWDLSGQNLGENTADLVVIHGDLTKKYFIHGATNE